LLRGRELAGVFEIITFTEELTQAELQSLDGVAELAVIASEPPSNTRSSGRICSIPSTA